MLPGSGTSSFAIGDGVILKAFWGRGGDVTIMTVTKVHTNDVATVDTAWHDDRGHLHIGSFPSAALRKWGNA